MDLNAHLHGNWTVANAKSRLHQYLNQNRCPADFKYSTGGPDHNRWVNTFQHSYLSIAAVKQVLNT